MLERIKKEIRAYLTFSKSERNGIMVLIVLLIAVILIPGLVKYLPPPSPHDYKDFENEIKAFTSSLKDKTEDKLTPDTQTYFTFDPNNLPETDWKLLGLTPRQIKTIHNYESKGGMFHKKEDLKKIYGISPELYYSLEPFIKIKKKEYIPAIYHDKKMKTSANHEGKTPVKTIKLNINTADSIQWTGLKGIGPVLSSRIIKYRKKLGGFAKTEQLREVYGLSEETFNSIEPSLISDLNQIQKIKINLTTAEELKSHPYLSQKTATIIVNYRTHNGNFKDINDLKKTIALSDSMIVKLAPYLDFD